MLFIFLSFSLCDQYEQAEKIKKNFAELQSGIYSQQEIMKNISEEISIISNKLKSAKISSQNSKKNIDLIGESNNKMLNQAKTAISNSIQDSFTSKIKSSPINISLVLFSSNEERKSIDTISQLKSKFISRFKPPNYQQDQNGFYQINGTSANFTFLSHHVERISKIEINQTVADECGVKYFKVICTDHQNTFTSEVYSVKPSSEKPQVFYFNRTVWFKSMILNVIENFGGDHICLPNVRVFDNDYYSEK